MSTGRDLVGLGRNLLAAFGIATVVVSGVNGLFTDNRSIPDLFTQAASVTAHTSHNVGAFVRRTALSLIP